MCYLKVFLLIVVLWFVELFMMYIVIVFVFSYLMMNFGMLCDLFLNIGLLVGVVSCVMILCFVWFVDCYGLCCIYLIGVLIGFVLVVLFFVVLEVWLIVWIVIFLILLVNVVYDMVVSV